MFFSFVEWTKLPHLHKQQRIRKWARISFKFFIFWEEESKKIPKETFRESRIGKIAYSTFQDCLEYSDQPALDESI